MSIYVTLKMSDIMKHLSFFFILSLFFIGCKTTDGLDMAQEEQLQSDLDACRATAEGFELENQQLQAENKSLQNDLMESQERIEMLINEQEELLSLDGDYAELSYEYDMMADALEMTEDSLVIMEYELTNTADYMSAMSDRILHSSSYSAEVLLADESARSAMLEDVEVQLSRNAREMSSLRSIAAENMPQYNMIEKNVAIYCPTEMVYNQTYDVKSIIPDLIREEDIRNSLVQTVLDHNPDMTEEELQEDVIIEQIEYLNLVELELNEVVENSFTIKPMHTENRQQVGRNMRGWHWKVTPISEERRQQLYMNAHVFDADGNRLYQFDKTFKIDISVDMSGFVYKFQKLVMDDPKWAVVTLLIPFVTFLYGLFTGKKKIKGGSA